MSPTTSTIQTLEQALTDLPAKLRVHELAKRAGLTSKDVLAALSAAGVKASSAASSVGADDATAALTTLLGAPDTQDATAAPAQAAAPAAEEPTDTGVPAQDPGFFAAPLFLPPAEAKPTARRRRSTKPAPEPATDEQPALPADTVDTTDRSGDAVEADTSEQNDGEATGTSRSGRRRRGRSGGRGRGAQPEDTESETAPIDELPDPSGDVEPTSDQPVEPDAEADVDDDDADDQARRRRRRGRRGRGRAGDERADEQADPADAADTEDEPVDSAQGAEPVEDESDDESGDEESGEEGGTRRRRRRRRRSGSAEHSGEDAKSEDDPDNTVVHVREPRPPRESTPRESTSSAASEVQGIRGSTRLEAKRQRRRDSRGDRKRPQILTEAEFLARREAVDRVMAVRQRGDLAQVALLEDGILVEHFVSRAGSESLMGNIYLGKVQNVLPSMEAAFVDIGKGRNAVLYAGEVNWDAAGLGGKARRIETALSGGDTILVQVSKDPVGQKGARLTTQISLPGRFLVYVPGGGATGISRKLPDTERKRLKSILDRIVPEDAGVIIRTAAEGVAEEELARDVDRLKSQWEQISRQAEKKANAPLLLSAEPDTLIKVVRDLFNSDISRLVLDGERAYEPVAAYIEKVAPELAPRVSRYDGPNDVFAAYRIDEQIAKALERKVFLPSGGSLVIDRTEAMTVVDVNTGKYTGSGGNLEETVTKNNLEAAEEVVRQLRLRDIGGIIVVDFIDMVLESNRELVMRRLTECLGRDRTRHQVAEVTSLGLIQMTRKKMGTGLVEAFSEPCPHCQGRGLLLHDVPMEDRSGTVHEEDQGKSRRRGKGRQESAPEPEPIVKPAPAAVRPPDPRGPKPPTRGTDESTPGGEDAESLLLPAAIVPDRTPVDAGSNASFNAPRSRDASDAVSAVLAALDAQATRQGSASAGAATSTATDVATEAAAPSAGRGRGRRAAGRPAGAPSATTATEPTDTASARGDDPAAQEPVLEAVPASDAVVDHEVVEQQAVAGLLGQAASEFAATDLVVAPDVDGRQTESRTVEVVELSPVANGPEDAEPAPPVEQQPEPVARATRPRRRAGRPAGAAGTPVEVATAASVPAIESEGASGNGLAVDDTGNGAAGGSEAAPAKAAPRRRRAASRPAGPAGAPVSS